MKDEDKTNKEENVREAKALVPHTGNLPSIPDEKIDQIISLSDDRAIWVKVVEGGLKITSQDKFVKFLHGRIVDANAYLIRFEGGSPTKLPNVTKDVEIPEGYERRCDVKFLIRDEVFGLSLAPSSALQLSRYLKYLKNRNLRLENVLTRVTSKQASNKHGTWPVAVFELADPPETESPKNYPKEWE